MADIYANEVDILFDVHWQGLVNQIPLMNDNVWVKQEEIKFAFSLDFISFTADLFCNRYLSEYLIYIHNVHDNSTSLSLCYVMSSYVF